MADVLTPGTIADFPAGSMADEIEKAFLAEWPAAMGTNAPATLNNQMRLMFVAVAQGVIKHLSENPGAFQVLINNGGVDATGAVSGITTTTFDN